MALLLFCVTIITGLILTKQTSLSISTDSPLLTGIILWIAVLWLCMVEGGQASLVGLGTVSQSLYRQSHSYAHKCCAIVHRGDNLDRYLLGRQFLVVLIVFVINLCGAPESGAALWNLPPAIANFFLVSGLAMILFTSMVGQLNSQVIATQCMLDYIDNHLALFTVHVAMAVEFSGLLNASYVVQFLVAALAGQSIQSNEEPRTGFRLAFFLLRCLFSLAVLFGCLAVTLQALLLGQTTMWHGIPVSVSILLFVCLLSVVGMLEGIQIAVLAVSKLPASKRSLNWFAKLSCDLLFGDGENRMLDFMIGRQLCVVSCFFIIARVNTIRIDADDYETRPSGRTPPPVVLVHEQHVVPSSRPNQPKHLWCSQLSTGILQHWSLWCHPHNDCRVHLVAPGSIRLSHGLSVDSHHIWAPPDLLCPRINRRRFRCMGPGGSSPAGYCLSSR